MPPPPPVSRDANARPVRLRAANRRLKEVRALPIEEKIALSHNVIDTLMAATNHAAVAFSGGRDSLVALHLTLDQRPDVPVVFTNTGIEFPETVQYVRQTADAWNLNLHELRVRRNYWKLARERGLPIGGRGNGYFLKELASAADVKLSNSCCNQLKITPARQHYRSEGIEGVVTGLRTEESLMRRLNFADYGALRYSRDYGALVAWPLYAWSRQEIEDYIAAHQLPVNPIYKMGHDRVGCWACMHDFLHEDSRLFVLKRTHPGMYETLKKQFGDEMLRVLAAWGEVQHMDFSLEHFDALYTPCGIELLRHSTRQRRRASPGDEDDPLESSNP
jgi:phosphoadenosine phosphosulfate reductase